MAIGNNDKLIAQLRVGINLLKTDVEEANKIITGIKMDNLHFEVISDADKKKTLADLNEIKNEINAISKTGINVDTVKTAIKEISTGFQHLDVDTKNAGSSISGIETKVTEFYKTSAKEALTTAEAWKKTSETIAAGGKKIAETTYAPTINAQGEAIQKEPSTKIVTDEPTSQLTKITTAYQKLAIENKINAQNLKELANEVEKVSTDYNLQGDALKKAQTQQLSYIAEAKKQLESINKITSAIEKQGLAELSLYTQEKAQTSQYDSMSKTLAKISGESNLAMSSSNFGSSMFDRFKVSAAYTVASTAIYSVRQSFANAIQTNRDYEASLVDLKRILGDVTQNEMTAYGKQAVQLSKDFGEPLKEVQATYSALAAAGIQTKADLNSMAKTVSMGLNTSDITSGAQLTDLLTSSMKQLGIATSESEKVLDSWNYLADKHIAKTSDFAEATSKAGMASKAMGIDINELNAMVAVLSDNTSVSGSEIGDALKSMENRLERPKTLETLKSYGIEVMADANHFKSFSDIIANVNVVLDKFGENTTQSNEILDALGGTMRKNWVTILAANQDKIGTVAQSSAIDSIGYSATKSAATMDTLEKKIQVFKNSISELYISTGNGGGLGQLKGIVDFGTWLAEAGSWMAPVLLALGEAAILVKTISGTLSVIKGQNLTQMLDKINIPQFNIAGANFGGATTSVKAYQSAVSSLQQHIIEGSISAKESSAILEVVRDKIGLATTSTNTFASAEGALKNAEFASSDSGKKLASEMEVLKASQEGTSASAKGLAASDEALNTVQKTTAASAFGLQLAMIGITLGVTLVIGAIVALIQNKKTLSEQIDDVNSKLKDTTTTDNLIKQYDDLTMQIKDNTKSGVDNTDVKKQLLDIEQKLAAAVPGATTGYDDQNNAITTNIEKVKTLNEEKKKQALIDADNAYNTAKTGVITTNSNMTNDIGVVGNYSYQNKSVVEQYENYKKLRDAVGTSAEAQTNYNRKVEESQKKIEEFNKASTQAYNLGMKNVDYYDLASGKVVKYSDYINSNTSSTNSNTSATNSNTAAKDANVTSTDTQEQAYAKLSQLFDDTTNKINFYNTALSELNKNHYLSAGTTKTMLKSYPELIGFLGSESGMRDRLISLIKDQGITQQQTYAQMVQTARDGMTQEERDKVDSDNAKLQTDNKYYQQNVLNNSEVINHFRDVYGVDLNNYKNLAEAKLAVEKKLMTELSSAWEKYDQALSNTLAKDASLANSLNSGNSAESDRAAGLLSHQLSVREAQSNVNYFQNLLSGLNTDFSSIGLNFSSIDLGNTGYNNGIGSKSPKSSSSVTDKAKTAAEAAEKARLDALKKASDEIIAGYQAQIDALNVKADAEDRATKQLEYQNQLIKDQTNLQNAQNEKNVRIYENGRWQWEADRSAIKEAQDALTSTQAEFASWTADNVKTDKIAALQALIKAQQDKATLGGYASGTDYVPQTGLYKTTEDGAELHILNKGDGVLSHAMTTKLLNLANYNPASFTPNIQMPNFQQPTIISTGNGDTVFKIGQIILPEVKDSRGFIDKMNNYNKTH